MSNKSLLLALGASLSLGMGHAVQAESTEVLSAQKLSQAYAEANKKCDCNAECKCEKSNCTCNKPKTASKDDKNGEGKCGEGKCGEGKCGS
jgi:uncharacterized low-complexity protein